MAGLRKISVTGNYEVSWRSNGSRKAKTFTNRKEAIVFKKKLEQQKIFLPGDVNQVTIQHALNLYRQTETSKKSERTQAQEKSWFEDLYVFLIGSGLETVDQIQLEHLKVFRSGMADIKSSTINRRFNTFKHFFSSCEDLKFTTNDPCRKLKKLDEDEFKRKKWTDDQVEKFIEATKDYERDAYLVMLITGMRPSSVEYLRWDHAQEDCLSVPYRKGRSNNLKFYDIPLIAPLKAILKRQESNARGPSSPIFLNSKGSVWSGYHLSRRATQIIKDLKFPQGLSLYGFRTRMGTELVKGKVDLETVRKILGHKSLAVTKKYVQLETEDLGSAMGKVLRFKDV